MLHFSPFIAPVPCADYTLRALETKLGKHLIQRGVVGGIFLRVGGIWQLLHFSVLIAPVPRADYTLRALVARLGKRFTRGGAIEDFTFASVGFGNSWILRSNYLLPTTVLAMCRFYDRRDLVAHLGKPWIQRVAI